jgi:hypothetical protein
MSETHGNSKLMDEAVEGVLTMLHDKGYSMDDTVDILAFAIQVVIQLKRTRSRPRADR